MYHSCKKMGVLAFSLTQESRQRTIGQLRVLIKILFFRIDYFPLESNNNTNSKENKNKNKKTTTSKFFKKCYH